MRTIPIPDNTADMLFGLLETRPARLVEDEEVKGFLIPPIQYNALVELLEDIADLRDAAIAEAEYAVGQGRPFDAYDVERKAKGGEV
ncbi:MAG: hypothetical protein ISS49_08270 [Anaerolineae bacterium]|nr:hypothetical protein [Anaerolineae bacterium]